MNTIFAGNRFLRFLDSFIRKRINSSITAYSIISLSFITILLGFLYAQYYTISLAKDLERSKNTSCKLIFKGFFIDPESRWDEFSEQVIRQSSNADAYYRIRCNEYSFHFFSLGLGMKTIA
jgi:hypothetical protein